MSHHFLSMNCENICFRSSSIRFPSNTKQCSESNPSRELQEKRYRSMQEHIRRAHPEHYISKLPATEESFLLMINTPPSERRHPDQSSTPTAQGLSHSQPVLPPPVDHLQGFHERHNYHRDESSNPGTPRHADELGSGGAAPVGPMLGTASAAAALAELHGVKNERDADFDGVSSATPPLSITKPPPPRSDMD
ncbi:hypothetical protein QQX98_004254 [Neonectria punicea]|uniref:Uncharacterized protein n=1 Tax=Neonectria punicea TaxID=979145 RepID=A0ABR1HAL0_9HYPO